MKAENHDAQAIFGEALRLSAPGERQAFLDHACAGDQALRQEVESLLSAYDRAGGFLDPFARCALPWLAKGSGTA
jgi:eukaryotic-like serine/threonine-protein kinase